MKKSILICVLVIVLMALPLYYVFSGEAKECSSMELCIDSGGCEAYAWIGVPQCKIYCIAGGYIFRCNWYNPT